MTFSRSLKTCLVSAAIAGAMITGASSASANANAYLFGYTYAPNVYGPQELTINGSTVISADTTGWYDVTGSHQSSNPDYIVGNCSIGSCGGAAAYNNFFTFDLSGVTGPITSAVLSAGNPVNGYSGAPTATYTTYDVSTSIAALNSDNFGATGIYNDLGSGASYGAVGVGVFDNGADVSVTFNSTGLSALTASEGGEFAVGGSLGTFTAPGVPEPASWALMLLGVGALGATHRSRRGSVSAAA